MDFLQNLFSSKRKANEKEILMLCKDVCYTKETEMDSVQELLIEIHKFKIVELVDFSIQVKNAVGEFKKAVASLLDDEERGSFDAAISFIGMLYKRTRERKCEKKLVEIYEKMRNAVSLVCVENVILKRYIDGFLKRQERSMLLKGFDFARGIVEYIPAERVIALLITKLINQSWKEVGVTNEQLMTFDVPKMIEEKKY